MCLVRRDTGFDNSSWLYSELHFRGKKGIMGSGESCAWLGKSYLLLNRPSSQRCWRKKLPMLRGNAQQGRYVLQLVLWSDSKKKNLFLVTSTLFAVVYWYPWGKEVNPARRAGLLPSCVTC